MSWDLLGISWDLGVSKISPVLQTLFQSCRLAVSVQLVNKSHQAFDYRVQVVYFKVDHAQHQLLDPTLDPAQFCKLGLVGQDQLCDVCLCPDPYSIGWFLKKKSLLLASYIGNRATEHRFRL